MSFVECLIITSNPKNAFANLAEFLASEGNLASQLTQTRRTFCHATVEKEKGRVPSHYVTCLLTREVFDRLYEARQELSANALKLERYDFTKTPGPSAADKPHLVVYLKNLPTFRERGWLLTRVESFLRGLTSLGYLKPTKVHTMRNSGGEVDASILKIYFDDAEPEQNRRFVSALFNNMSFYVPHDIVVEGPKFLLHRIKNSWLRDSAKQLQVIDEDEEKPVRKVAVEQESEGGEEEKEEEEEKAPRPIPSRTFKKTLSRPKALKVEQEEE